jgi:hypothetical protein
MRDKLLSSHGRNITSYASIKDELVKAEAFYERREVGKDEDSFSSRHPGDL